MLRLELSVNEEIIYDTAVRMTHHTIKNLTRLETTDLIGKYKVNECLSIWSADENLTHVRNVEHTHLVADSVVLIHNVRILDRHIESCKRTHFGAKCHMTVMKTGYFKILFHSFIVLFNFSCYNFCQCLCTEADDIFGSVEAFQCRFYRRRIIFDFSQQMTEFFIQSIFKREEIA